MLTRDRLEKNYKQLFEQRKYGITSWGALNGGLLAGKYIDGIPEGSRLEIANANPSLKHFFERYLAPGKIDETNRKIAALADIAKENNTTMAALATAWILAYEDVSCALSGFTKKTYIDDNLSSLVLLERWNFELEKKIEDAL